ncbi:hypothetical protein EVAR_70947_1 [Eumeta japonica]|uniref:Uncharacterized protein n=1 Tax=Eumeta variegata TaxID=151549 RepID=A0A4C2A097_EUMVA|nr:hypothetical protein EVAR_70947_1 [Eumeta japonica]
MPLFSGFNDYCQQLANAPGCSDVNLVSRHKPKAISLISFNAHGLDNNIKELGNPRVHLDEADDEEPRADCVTSRGRGGDLYLSSVTRRAPSTPLHLRELLNSE